MKKYVSYIGAMAATVLLSAGLLMSCEDTDYPAAQPATGPSTNQARYLFVNAAPGAPALNFFVENTQLGQSLTSGQASTSYVAGQTGTVQLRARAATGAIGGIIGSNDILFRGAANNQNNFVAATGASYTVFVTDTLNRPRPTTTGATNPGGPQFLTVTDPLSQTLTAGAGGVRFFHLAPDAGLPVSSTATNPSVLSVRLTPTPQSGTLNIDLTNRAYRNVATTAFTSVPAGTYRVNIYTGATISPTATPITSATVSVEATKLYTLYAQGLRRTNTLSVGRVQHN